MQPSEPRGFTGAYARYLALERTREDDTGWRLLRADHAPLIAALLGQHLAGDTRRRPSTDVIDLVEADLDELRSFGIEIKPTAARLVANWRSDGYLVARPVQDARGETLELSAGALAALRTLDELVAPRQAVTESRLATVAAQLTQLAIASDPDQSRRLASLREERARLDAEIARVGAGEYEPLEQHRATERFRDILAMAEEIPSDFAKVRAGFERLNLTLRERVLDSADSQGHVLNEIFRGVDLIDESDEGRSFNQFLALLLDPEAGADFDLAVDQVLDRDFAGNLEPGERRFLRRFRTHLKTEGREIHQVVAGFARGLHGYVRSQQYQRDRELRRILRSALSDGLRASKHIKPFRVTEASLELTALSMSSVGELSLYDPAAMDAEQEVIESVSIPADYEALKAITRETEIDFAELRIAVEDTLRVLSPATLGDVLAHFPATQGVASVVGLMALAIDEGEAPWALQPLDFAQHDPSEGSLLPTDAARPGQTPDALPGGEKADGTAAAGPPLETVTWSDLDGKTNTAVIQRFVFGGREEENE